MCPHPLQRTGVATARPQTQGADSVHLLRHFSSKSLPSTIQRPKAQVNYQKVNMIRALLGGPVLAGNLVYNPDGRR